jgi:fructose-1-phosphate kinase PfkB-like protein
VVLDADGEVLKAGMAAAPFMIKPNLHELQRLVGRELPDDAAIHAALDELLDAHAVELIVLTRGHEGVLAATRGARLQAKPPACEARTSVGAGDSMIAGFLHAYQGPDTLGEALCWGVAAGTACVVSPGTELAHLADVRRFRALVEVEPVRT